MDVGLITAAFSLATLALSRCRCLVRRTESGTIEYGIGFTEHQLLPDKPKMPPETSPAWVLPNQHSATNCTGILALCCWIVPLCIRNRAHCVTLLNQCYSRFKTRFSTYSEISTRNWIWWHETESDSQILNLISTRNWIRSCTNQNQILKFWDIDTKLNLILKFSIWWHETEFVVDCLVSQFPEVCTSCTNFKFPG